MAEPAADRLTRRARQALHFANEEAQALNHPYVGAEHILLGLVREGAGVAAWVLDELGVRLIQTRETVAALVSPGAGQQRTGQHLSSSARTVIAQARQEADQLSHAYVGTEHLLLGLVREDSSTAAEVLSRMGVPLEQVRALVMDVVSENPSTRTASLQRAERAVGGHEASVAEPPAGETLTAAGPPARSAPVLSRAMLTTHVLDTAQGRPASGLRIELWWLGPQGNERTLLKNVTTNRDGRTDEPLLTGEGMLAGVYELVFSLGDYFISQGLAAGTPLFLDRVPLRFGIADPQSHYHVPLLASPWSYSTYRGS